MNLKFLTRAIVALLAVVVFSAPMAASAADLTVTAASVVRVTGDTETGTAGETLTAGQAVYKKASDSKWYKADCNSATAEVRIASAIALNGGAAGQPVVVQKTGSVTIGATMTAGTVYYLSGTAGGIRPVADNTTGDYPQTIGMATSTTVLQLGFNLRATSAL
jgi:hypothetical protein